MHWNISTSHTSGNTPLSAPHGREKPFDAAMRVGDDLLMFRYAFHLAASAVADAPKAAVLITLAAADGARS
ncbi:hypothetical protein [Streptomyces phaeochromogenes]|uniref:hypothetical protein n=1 Tax=Streptomyces phaeochromogenes TaxID=1923 RepID=UPI0006E342FA|nr:hypothetical protein [Streptomyces phaeochromogenes]